MPRRFPPPWTVEELDACFVVIDSAEQKLAYVYFEEESGRRTAAKLLTKDEARRIAGELSEAPRATNGATALALRPPDYRDARDDDVCKEGCDGDTKFLSYVALDSDAHRFFIRCVLGDSRSSIYPWI